MRLVMILSLLLNVSQLTSDTGDLRIEAIKSDNVRARTYVAPAMIFKVVAGKPTQYEVLKKCRQVTDTQAFADHADNHILVECEGGVRLELKAVYLWE